MTPLEFRAMMDKRNANVAQRVAALASTPFTEEEIKNLETMLYMGESEGACMYGYSDTSEDCEVFIARAMAILRKANR